MGDRANVALWWSNPQTNDRSSKEAVFLYTHWDGYRLPEIVRGALARSVERWGDDQYLARVIFEDMIDDDNGSITGYGITTRLYDNEHPVIVIDQNKQIIYTISEQDYCDDGLYPPDDATIMTLSEYVHTEGKERTWDNVSAPIGAAS